MRRPGDSCGEGNGMQMELEQVKHALRQLRADELREVLAEFAPGDGTAKDLAELQYSLSADRREFLRELAALAGGGGEGEPEDPKGEADSDGQVDGARAPGQAPDARREAFAGYGAFDAEVACELLGPEVRSFLDHLVDQGKIDTDGRHYRARWVLRDVE